jgi:Ca2+/H+ antiporter
VLLIVVVTGQEIVLGLDAADTVLLPLTLFVSFVNFSNGRSNYVQGLVHLSCSWPTSS